MFQNARNVLVNGGNFTVEHNGMTGLQILHRWVSDGAAHDSAQHAPVCHPDTRKTIIGDIMSWIGDPDRTSSVLWFNGPAGAGKTAIAHSICKRCAAAQWLAGSFFFSRYAHDDAGRSNAEFLIPTISFALSLAIPDVGKIVDQAVANDPSIPTKALEIQLEKLILEPLQQVSEEPKQPIVIIIDGLDECEGEEVQSNVLRLLGSVFQRPLFRGYDRIRLIVTSRPEPWICDEFIIEPLFSITRQIFLGQTPEANDDIRTFLRLGFTEIHDSRKHRLTMSNVAKPWPSYRVLDDLVDKASGQFIYPATVLKFVDDPNYRPTDRLKIIASMPVISPSAFAQKPLAALDQLYSQILSSSSDKQRTLFVLAALIAMQPTLSGVFGSWTPKVDLLRIAEKLLGLHPGDGPQALRMIHSLVHIPERSLISDVADDYYPSPLEQHYWDKDEIRFHHKSFIDYLLDPSRSLEYRVGKLGMRKMHMQLALACIVKMQTFSMRPRSKLACITWGYAMLGWTHHVTESGIPQQTLLQALMSFDVFACYLDTFDRYILEFECRDTVKRLAFRSRPATVISKIAENLPSILEMGDARNFLSSLGPGGHFKKPEYSLGLGEVVKWLQRNPDTPPELIRHYQVVVDILKHYSRSSRSGPYIPNDDHLFTNVHKAPGFSIVDIWTNVNKLLKLLFTALVKAVGRSMKQPPSGTRLLES